jgi:hypothetical protein
MKQTLFVDQGTDFSDTILITNFDGTPVNVASYVFNGVVRKDPYSILPSANLAITAADAPNGNVQISLSAANTANLEQGTYIYTVIQKNTANQTSILQDGFFIVLPSTINTQPTPQTVIFPQVLPNTTFYNTANSDQFHRSSPSTLD